MKFEIEISQKGKYGEERLTGKLYSYELAEQLAEMVIAGFEETEVKITAVASNKTKQEDE